MLTFEEIDDFVEGRSKEIGTKDEIDMDDLDDLGESDVDLNEPPF